ncbi:MAG: SPOR domain-containing protein [Rhodospirillales bacterium]
MDAEDGSVGREVLEATGPASTGVPRKAVASAACPCTGPVRRSAVIALGFCAVLVVAVLIGRESRAQPPGNPGTDPDPPAETFTPVTRPDEDLLILQLRFKQFTLKDAFVGYLNDGGLLLPLGEFVRALDFPIAVEPESGRANGWFLSENRLFSLDLARHEVIIEGKRASFNPQMAEAHTEDIFVDARLLTRWFPVDISFDLASLLVTLTSREPLPIERRLAREKRWEKLRGRRQRESPDYPKADIPYQALAWPFIDTSVEFAFQRNDRGKTEQRIRYDTIATGDVVHMNAKLFVTGNDDEPLDQARLTLGRKDPEGGLLGDLGATNFAFGDIFTPDLTMISRSQLGRGAQISSFPLHRSTEFDTITLHGDLPVGWEIELYRNEVLLDFQASRADGLFDFEDVPLLFGFNLLRLKFYGPQGQRREEVRRILVGQKQLPPGENYFRIAVNQQERLLLTGDTDTTGDESQGKNRAFVEFEHGLTRNLSLTANASTIPRDDGRRSYAGIGARGVMGPVFGQADVVRDSVGGWAGTLALQTGLAGLLNLSGEHGRFSGFESERVEATDSEVQSRSKLRLDGVIPVPVLLRIPYSLTAERDTERSGRTETKITNRLSAALNGLSVSNKLTWQQDRADGSKNTTLTGDLFTGGRYGRLALRSSLSYELKPVRQLTTSTITADWRINRDTSYRFAIARQLNGKKTTTFTAGLNNRFDWFALGLLGDYSTDHSLNARLTLSFSFGREPRTGRWSVGGRNIADKGAISARVFLDENQNGRFDAGDQPIEGVTFIANNRRISTPTGEDGMAFITGLPAHRATNFTILRKSLEDPFWIPRPEGVAVVVRPGVVGQADFAVVSTGEVDGTVYRRRGTSEQEIADVVVQLLDTEGKLVTEVKTAFDGFYLFEFVPPGHYVVRIDPEQMARLKLTASPESAVGIHGDSTVVNGVDFTVQTAAAGDKKRAARAPLDAVPPPAPKTPAKEAETAPAPKTPAKEAETAPAPKTPAKEAETAPAYKVQLAAERSLEGARGEWERLRRKNLDLLGRLTLSITKVDLGPEKGVFYRLRAGPVGDKAAARALCAKLARREMGCLVVRPGA